MKRSWLKRKKRKPKPTKLPQLLIPLWSLDKADDEFSLFIRKRDGRCMFPNCPVDDIRKLQCSHFHGRAHKGTRFDPRNCIALCWLHHYGDKLLGFEYQKQREEKHGYDGQYTKWMKTWLSPSDMAEIDKLATNPYPQGRAIMDVMRLLGVLQSHHDRTLERNQRMARIPNKQSRSRKAH